MPTLGTAVKHPPDVVAAPAYQTTYYIDVRKACPVCNGTGANPEQWEPDERKGMWCMCSTCRSQGFITTFISLQDALKDPKVKQMIREAMEE